MPTRDQTNTRQQQDDFERLDLRDTQAVVPGGREALNDDPQFVVDTAVSLNKSADGTLSIAQTYLDEGPILDGRNQDQPGNQVETWTISAGFTRNAGYPQTHPEATGDDDTLTHQLNGYVTGSKSHPTGSSVYGDANEPEQTGGELSNTPVVRARTSEFTIQDTSWRGQRARRAESTPSVAV